MPKTAIAAAILLGLTCLVPLSAAEPKQAAAPAKLTAAEKDFFETKIRPVLVKRCYECHSSAADKSEGNLLLDSRDALHKGGDTGPAIVPGEPGESVLLQAIRYEDLEMPPDGKLADEVIADFEKWIRMGAPDPRVAKSAEQDDAPKYVAIAPEELWSLQPVVSSAPPQTKNNAWPRTDIDRYVLSELEAAGIAPVADANPAALLRRVYFDLVGLPPSPEELDAFLADPSRQAFEAVVDKLLASPRFGERWGRHWLDVARFAESNGKSRDVLMPHAWRYRDYVIDVYNNDLPYDRFITEQIAGDLLPADSPADHDRLVVATGFLAVGSKTLTGATTQMDLIDEQIDTTSKAVLGLTVACARCHDHKFDPVPTRDYYSLAGIFLSTDTRYGGGLKAGKDMATKTKQLLVLGPQADDQVAQISKHEKQLADLGKRQKSLADQQKKLRPKLPDGWQQRLKTLSNETETEKAAATNEEDEGKDKPLAKEDQIIVEYASVMSEVQEVKQQLDELQKAELPELDFAVGVRDAGKTQDCRIHVRGDLKSLGDPAPRGVLSCVSLNEQFTLPSDQSGRLELAQWLTHPHNPLTPRVAVNRIWLHLMGRGLVGTVDNFGANGERPTHPELLDYLAARFVAGGWSTKQAIREIVLSHTYQLSTEFDKTAYAADPDNMLHWRMNRRRLEAEALRDAMLAASGKLQRDPPEVAIMAQVGDGEVGRQINTKPINAPFHHRSVYLPIIRGMVPEMLKVFDFPEPSNVQGQRDTTNVPSQSLFLMNSPLVIEQAETLAKHVLSAAKTDKQRVALIYKRCLTRLPAASETERMLAFVDGAAASETKNAPERQQQQLAAWTTVCQALLASGEFRFLD